MAITPPRCGDVGAFFCALIVVDLGLFKAGSPQCEEDSPNRWGNEGSLQCRTIDAPQTWEARSRKRNVEKERVRGAPALPAPALWTGRWATGFSLAFRGPSWIWRRHHKCNINCCQSTSSLAGMCPTIIPRLYDCSICTLEYATWLCYGSWTAPPQTTLLPGVLDIHFGAAIKSPARLPVSRTYPLDKRLCDIPSPNLVIIPHGTRPRRSANDASNAREHRHKHRTRQKSPPADSLYCLCCYSGHQSRISLQVAQEKARVQSDQARHSQDTLDSVAGQS
ncbi:hypothetical protein CCHR01_07813 [Colletotrichum chrysophilum]|uniref:Uncharacterized protein n=1 Tax=Colletotrichum chrysophilum TaxID=1836956 RepID=A0AAD9EIE6_9PEZI|nr:hypothetical protein CCHR01_07813 [Colletotrichum chrysophilum]